MLAYQYGLAKGPSQLAKHCVSVQVFYRHGETAIISSL